jgi:hypothetical protein
VCSLIQIAINENENKLAINENENKFLPIDHTFKIKLIFELALIL